MTDLTPGICMAAAAICAAHGPPQSRDRIAAALVAEAERLAALDPPKPESETMP